jgi:hypothetical protein
VRPLLLVALVALAACRRATPPPPPTTPHPTAAASPTDDAERGSLIDIANGATVISRTGETFLGVAADAAIDGENGTFWQNPPHDLPQSIVFGLPARSRIERVGIRSSKPEFTANHVQFESSLDGLSWHPLTTISAKVEQEAQWADVTPADAAYLRVTALDGRASNDVRLHSIMARGAELEPPRLGPIKGCWSLNGSPAVFERRGGRILGAVSLGGQPIYLDGGGNGRVYRFVWIRGNDFGLAMMTVSPDGKHLTGLVWHEEPIPLFRADTWFGEPAPCGALHPRDDVPQALLRRTGRYSVFGDYFPPGDRIVAHEFREATPEKNKERARQELERLHVTGVAAGSEAPRQPPTTDAMRLIYSSVDVEIRR